MTMNTQKPPRQARMPSGHTRSAKRPRRRRSFLTTLGILSLLALIAIGLNQTGVLALLQKQWHALLPHTTAQGVLEDGQTDTPLTHTRMTLSAPGFQASTTTDAQGRFSLDMPALHQVLLAVANYDPQTITPRAGLLIKLAPDPEETARRFLDAFLHGQVQTLWSMLHPDAQALWPDATALGDFLARKFGDLPVRSFVLGPSRLASSFVDPQTTTTYTSVAVLPASLLIAPSSSALTPPSEQAVMTGLFEHLPIAEVKNAGLWRVLEAGPLDREAPLVIPSKAPALKAQVPILMYHHVSPLPTRNALDFGLTVTEANFQQQMNYLAINGYHPVTLTDLFNSFYYQVPLPSHPIVITFDDGYEDNYLYAFPILKAHHFVAQINIITGMIGNRYLTWNQIREMAAWGIEFGSHTIHHVSLAAVSPTTATQELLNSKITLEAELGQPIQFFCYPSGEPFHHGTPERQQFITNLLAQDGYVGALLDPPPTSSLQDAAHPYQLNRIRVSGGEGLALFISILTSVEKVAK
jgi:peptidoglycan/xylan/chitin deacetylase (PgdA/CDA1 family)